MFVSVRIWLCLAEPEGAGGVKYFLQVFKRRMVDYEHVQNSDRFSMFRMYGHSLRDVQTYLRLSMGIVI